MMNPARNLMKISKIAIIFHICALSCDPAMFTKLDILKIFIGFLKLILSTE